VSDRPRLGALLDALDEHGVDYLVTGSVAARAHGAPGVEPADLDIIPSTDVENLGRLMAVLESIGAEMGSEYGEWRIDDAGEREWIQDGRLRPPRPLDPTDAGSFDHWFESFDGRLDVVPEAAGRHEDIRPRAVRLPVEGRVRWVASPSDVLAAMTRPRRPKDAPRVRHLRQLSTATAGSSGVGFVGFRTDRFEAMVALFRDRIGLDVIREAPGATWFRLAPDAELHVYAATDPDHAFFTTGPVVGLRVADVDATRAALEADGLRMLTDVERTATAAWCHVEAPDGTVLEIIGPPAGG
jgi:hypothetical protein